MKAAVGRLAFRVARSSGGGRLVAVATRFVPRLLPGVLTVLDDAVLLRHPAPIEPGHLLLLPRTWIGDFSDTSPAVATFLNAVDTHLAGPGTDHFTETLATNLGDRQDVRFLHVHVFAASAADRDWTTSETLVACHDATASWALESTRTAGTAYFRRPPTGPGWQWAIDRAEP